MENIVNVIYYIVPFIVLLGILVFVHEFGHFIVARMLGVKVAAFSVGFGKVLWNHTDKYGTNWRLSVIPLGGYCQFLGDADASSSTNDEEIEKMSDEDKKHAFAFQSAWKKMAIVVAGPAFNYLFAILIFVSIFYSFGRIVYPSVVGGVLQGEAADLAGIKAGDIIRSINGKNTPDFQSISSEVALSPNDNVIVKIERPGTIKLKTSEYFVKNCDGTGEKRQIIGVASLPIEKDENGAELPSPAVVGKVFVGSSAYVAGFKKGDILENINGMQLENFDQLKSYIEQNPDIEYEIKYRRPISFDVLLKDTQYTDSTGQTIKRRMLGIQSSPDVTFSERNLSFFGAVKAGCKEAYDLSVATLRSVGQMLTGERGGKEVGGIIRIAEMSGDISKNAGLISFIYFMALLSVNLGLINLLPIPALDGGHIVIYLVEIVTFRQLSDKVKDIILKIGITIILAILVLATWNDITHLINRFTEQ